MKTVIKAAVRKPRNARQNLGNSSWKLACILFILMTSSVPFTASAQLTATKTEVPDWALPGSATHKQVPPPANFHRATRTVKKKIGIFSGQSDIGGALVEGSSQYNWEKGQYTIQSAGYNIWYTRDEFRYLWKRMSGDVSLAADISFPDTLGYSDRKAVLIIRQTLDDGSKEAMVALHGAGLVHLAWRPGTGESIKQMRVDKKGAVRLGIEKQGDSFKIFVSQAGEPLHQYGDPIQLHLDGPFYVGIGFCSHIADKIDTASLTNVILENVAGKVQ